jgi:AAA ATPase domain
LIILNPFRLNHPMTDSTLSPIETVDAALLSHNPFAQPPFVNANNVWGKSFPDVESLNAHASDAVFKALEDIRSQRYSTTSMLITAQDGTGKTHIVSRIRHRLQAQGGALFVYANKFNDLNQIKSGFQQTLADSLSNIGSAGVKQWQELAAAMANDAVKAANLKAKPLVAKDLVKKFEGDNDEQMKKWISQLTTAFCRAKTVKDPDIVRAIFWTLSEAQSAYVFNWLAGKELAQFKANELRLPSQCQSFDAVLQVLDLISEYNELVICFDELDSLDFTDNGQLHKSEVVASLVKDLFENLKRGVILTVMMPGTWNDRIKKKLPGGVWNKMTAQGSPYDLQYMNGENVIELVTCFLTEFYNSRELNPPHPLYPFDDDQLKAIGREKPTVREVLQWCRDHASPPSTRNSAAQKVDPVELAMVNELGEDISACLDDNYSLADAIYFGFQMLLYQTVEEVTIEAITTEVVKKGRGDDYLNFKVMGKENDQPVSIGVAVLQYDGGKALGAGLRRLIDEENRFGLTRGCLVRSKSKPLNNYFMTTYLSPLIEQGGEFVELHEREVKPLIALYGVYQKRESDYKVSMAEIQNFITDKGAQYWLGAHNPLLKEILSNPSYQVPTDLEVEPDCLEEMISQSEETETSNLAELAYA